MNGTCRFLITRAALALVVLHPAPLRAQPTGPLDPGDEIRVSYRQAPASMLSPGRQSIYMEFVRMDESHIVGRSRGRLVVIDASAIRTVSRRVGTKPATAPAMVIGSGVGFAAGFLAGALAAAPERRPGALGPADRGLSTGVLLGAPLGALVAWLASRSRGIYEPVPIRRVRTAATLAPTGRVGVSLRFAGP